VFDLRSPGNKPALRDWLMRSAAVTLCIASAFEMSLPATGRTETYPWCIQGETWECYYMTREQCELTVDYHGFCVANPEALPSPAAPRSRSVRQRER